MRFALLALILAGCSPTSAPVETAPVVVKAPEVRGYAFLVCAKPLREAPSVEFVYTTSQNGGNQTLSLRPMDNGDVYCGQPEDRLQAGVPVTFYLMPADMTLTREIGIAYPSPDYSDDESASNLTDTVTQTDEQGRFVFLVAPESRGVKTIRMGTVRPGRPIVGLFPPNEKPAEEVVTLPPPAMSLPLDAAPIAAPAAN